MDVRLFIELLQVTLGNRTSLSQTPSEKEWYELYSMCQKQSIAPFVFTALDGLSKSGQKPPMALLYEWIGISEQVKLQNKLMNQEAARLKRVFEQAGRQTAILKGQANARLYSQPWSRQPGDIDIWVDGGRDKVVESLKALGMMEDNTSKRNGNNGATVSYHHIDLPKNENGVDVEVHFRPSSGNLNPVTNKRLQAFLEKEIRNENSLVEEGFRVPSMKFALVMQLAHIQRHLLSEGVGMRQVIDYYYLLKSDVNKERDDIFCFLGSFGLKHMAGALMWLLHEVLGLEEEYLIAPVDEKKGRMLLRAIMEGGNFGHHYFDGKDTGVLGKIYANHKKRLHLLRFDFKEAICNEMYSFYCFFAKKMK